MFNKWHKEPGQVARAEISLVAAKDLKPLTSATTAKVKALDRKGAVLWLDTPFIDGCHVLMDVHNITPKKIQVAFPGEAEGGEPPVRFIGNIETLNRLESPEGPQFQVEISWEEGAGDPAVSLRSLKRLLKGSAPAAPAPGARP